MAKTYDAEIPHAPTVGTAAGTTTTSCGATQSARVEGNAGFKLSFGAPTPELPGPWQRRVEPQSFGV